MGQNVQDYYVISGTFLCLESISTSIYRRWMVTLQKWLSNHLTLSSLELLVKYCHGQDIRQSNEALNILHRYFLNKPLTSLPTVARQYVKDKLFYCSLIDALQNRNSLFPSLSREEQEDCIVIFRCVSQLFDHFLHEIPSLITLFLQHKLLPVLCSGLQCFLCYYDSDFSGSDAQAIEEIRMIHIPQFVSPASIFIFIQLILSSRSNGS